MRAHYFVRHYEQVMLFRDGGYLLKLMPGEHLPNRIVGRIDNDHLRPRCDFATTGMRNF